MNIEASTIGIGAVAALALALWRMATVVGRYQHRAETQEAVIKELQLEIKASADVRSRLGRTEADVEQLKNVNDAKHSKIPRLEERVSAVENIVHIPPPPRRPSQTNEGE